MHSSLIGKIEKANRYARETDRITFQRLALEFRGDNDTQRPSPRRLALTCHYFGAGRRASILPCRRCWEHAPSRPSSLLG
jgi:hypothetical protein